jgi:hypothetical protein
VPDPVSDQNDLPAHPDDSREPASPGPRSRSRSAQIKVVVVVIVVIVALALLHLTGVVGPGAH